MTDKQLTVDLYIRVSTDRQAKEGDSLEEQENELKKFCDYRNFKINQILIEKGKSGGNTNRPEYKKLLADIEAKKINAIVVKKLDRLSRSLLDFEDLMTRLQTNEVEFISLRENFDTTTAMGKAMLRIALVFAQLEREQTSERISDVMHYRASLGYHNGGCPPYGYTSVNKELIIENREKPIVELIFSKFLEVHSADAVANFLNDRKILNRDKKVWLGTKVIRMLKNPTYKGMTCWKDQVYQGLHIPIIAPSVWDKVNTILEAKKSLKALQKSDALLQKLAICGHCGSPLTPSFAYNRFKTKYCYYRCGSTKHGKHRRLAINCEFKYVAFETLHFAVQMALDQISNPIFFASIEAKVSSHNDGIFSQVKDLTTQKQLEEETLKQIKAKRNEYVDVLITHAFSTQDKARIHERMNELEKEEKQAKSLIMSCDLEKTQLDAQLLKLDTFKHHLLTLKESSRPEQGILIYKKHLRSFVETLTVSQNRLIFRFKEIPWDIPIDIPF
jgi:site-specific DNA recombinase